MMKYIKPAVHITAHIGPLTNDQIAQLSDEELAAYLKEHGYWERKRLYQANRNYAYREIAGEGVLVPVGDVPGNVMITLNETGAFLWKALEQPATIGDLIVMAKEVYDAPQGELEKQIEEFIREKTQTGHIWEVQ